MVRSSKEPAKAGFANSTQTSSLYLSGYSHGMLFSKTGRKILEVRSRKNSLAVMPFSHFITPDRESWLHVFNLEP